MQDQELSQFIAKRIRQKREELGLTQEQLGNLSGLHRTYIGAIERAEKHITVITLKKIAIALNERITYFLPK